jgi:hypothetical protein
MHQFTFDLKLAGEITVTEDNEGIAELRLAAIIEDVNRIINTELVKSDKSLVSVDFWIDDSDGPLLTLIDGDDADDDD